MSNNKWTSNSEPGWQSKDSKFYDTLLEKGTADKAWDKQMNIQQ